MGMERLVAKSRDDKNAAVKVLEAKFQLPVSQMAVETIQQAIISGELAPEACLPPQRELARQLGVSRASLREALSVLETLGFLRVEPRRGVFVNARRPEKAPATWRFSKQYREHDVYELRSSLEGTAAKLAAMSDDSGLATELTSHISRMKTAGRDGLPEEFAISDFDFHLTIMRWTHNKLLLDVYAALRPLLIETQRLAVLRPAEYWEPIKEHERIVEAIKHHDPEGAAYLMQLHLIRAAHRSNVKLRI